MTCIAVTRGGCGGLWRFATRTDAYLHSLVQYGDPRISGPADILSEWNQLTWADLLRLLGMPVADDRVRSMPIRQARLHMEDYAPKVWDRMLSLASDPPTDANEIHAMVAADRRAGAIMAKKNHADAPAEGHPDAPPAADKKSNLPPVVKGPRGVPQDAVVTLGLDKEGKSYGPDNNPKKPGTKTHGRFAQYRNGMTIAEALAAGIETADLVYDMNKGFISISGGAPVAEMAAAA